MARDPETIQREIERARDALAVTLDELSDKASPTKLVESAKAGARSKLDDPRVKYALIGVGVLVGFLVVRKIFR